MSRDTTVVAGTGFEPARCRTDLSQFHGVLFPNPFPNLALADSVVAGRFVFEHKLRILASVSRRHCPCPLAACLRVARWLPKPGPEPTAQRRGLDSHRKSLSTLFEGPARELPRWVTSVSRKVRYGETP